MALRKVACVEGDNVGDSDAYLGVTRALKPVWPFAGVRVAFGGAADTT